MNCFPGTSENSPWENLTLGQRSGSVFLEIAGLLLTFPVIVAGHCYT